MEELGLSILKNYGLAAFVLVGILVFIGWIFNKQMEQSRQTLLHFMKNSEMKDKQIEQVSLHFAASLDANTKVIHESTEAQIKLAATTDEFQDWLKIAKETNDRDHREILDFVRAPRMAR